MPKHKVHAGLYQAAVKAGSYTIRTTGSKSWVVTSASGRRLGKFPSLSEANAWLESLAERQASSASVKYLRDLLAERQGSELAEQIRSYLNGEHVAGRGVSQADVSRAIDRLLRAGRSQPLIPAQRTLSKAEALASIRKTLSKV